MIGGLMKTTSRFALAAAAGLFVGGIAFTPANAADLGGDCCADLEERVAELEATTARKGNRKVSLEISGQVNRALLIWDDGVDSDAYVVDNDGNSTRFRLKGSAKMKPGWKAGFLIEIEVQDDASNDVDQNVDDGLGDTNILLTRHANWYIESEKFGRVTVGQGSPAGDDITLINLGGSLSDAELYYNTEFKVRSGVGNLADFGTADLEWKDLASALDSSRADVIRYDSPAIYGFIVSTSWGEDDVFEAAVRFQKEFNSVRIAAGIAYVWDGDDNTFGAAIAATNKSDSEVVKGSISVMHIPTGVYLSLAAGERELSDITSNATFDANSNEDASFYYAQLGITKKFNSYGATTIYAEYGRYEDYATGIVGDFNEGGASDNTILSSEVDRFGFGVVQAFDSAALELYASAHYYQAELDVNACCENSDNVVGPEDWMGVVTGARIKF